MSFSGDQFETCSTIGSRRTPDGMAGIYGHAVDHDIYVSELRSTYGNPEEAFRRRLVQRVEWGNQQSYWQRVSRAGGCTSKQQSLGVRLFLNRRRDGTIALRDSCVPIGRKFDRICEMFGRMGIRNEEGAPYKRPRMQQFVFEGLARQVVAAEKHAGRLGKLTEEEAFRGALFGIWQVMRRRRKGRRRWAKKPTIVCDKPRKKQINWRLKRERARLKGWKPPGRYWYLD